jgi:hypothetical protein
MLLLYGKLGERNPLNYVTCWKVDIVSDKLLYVFIKYTFHSIRNIFIWLLFPMEQEKNVFYVNEFFSSYFYSAEHGHFWFVSF